MSQQVITKSTMIICTGTDNSSDRYIYVLNSIIKELDKRLYPLSMSLSNKLRVFEEIERK